MMTRNPFIKQSRKYYWRFYRLVALAVVVMTGVLTGSLLLGDSVRGTLLQRVGERLGDTETVIASGFGFMSDEVLNQTMMANARGFLLSDGFVADDGKLLPVYVWGTDGDGLADGEALMNEPLKAKLGDASDIVLHLPAHNLVPSGSLFVTKSYATQMRLQVKGVKTVAEGGNLLLKNEQTLPLNVLVNRRHLAEVMELEGRLNMILSKEVIDEHNLAETWKAEWSGIHQSDTSLTYDGIFIPEDIVAKGGNRYFAYLVNDIVAHGDSLAYPFVTAVDEWQGEPLTGHDIILSDYAASRLHVGEGDSVSMSYFVAKDLKDLDTNSQMLRVKRVVPLADFMADSLLTADFPGLSHVEKCTDWDSDLPIKMERVTKDDEDFWYKYRQTPKAIVSYEAVAKDWANAFGSATAIRYDSKTDVHITPANLGILVAHPRSEGLRAASSGVDFGGLFLALGFFIILAAILLMKSPLDEMFTLRTSELQVLRQMGFSDSDIRHQWFRETFSVIFLASPFGVIAGLAYSSLTLWLLGNVWSGATHTEGFALHVQPLTVIVGWLVGLAICAAVLWWVLRSMVCSAKGRLQGKNVQWSMVNVQWSMVILLALTIFLTLLNFLTLHSLALFIVCGLLWIATGSFFLRWYIRRKSANHDATRQQIIWQTLTASMRQHQLAYWTLALGVFAVFAVGLNRPDFNDSELSSGGWQYYVESRVPIQYDLNNTEARRRLSLDALPDSTVFLQFLRHTQDEASCLNLNKVSTPTVLGIDLKAMETFGLHADGQPGALYIDEEALLWSLMKSVGDTIYYNGQWSMVNGQWTRNAGGETVPVVIAGSYPTGLFHGCAVMSKDDFHRLWPKESGSEVLLMKSSRPAEAAEMLATAMSEYGLTVQTTKERLQMFFEVTETYLIIFLTLGGLGLLLGVFSMIIIVRKNLTAQRPAIRQFRALGFSEPLIRRQLLRENLLVPLYALVAGATGAVISISANPIGAGFGSLLLAIAVLAALSLLLYFGIQHIIKYTINK